MYHGAGSDGDVLLYACDMLSNLVAYDECCEALLQHPRGFRLAPASLATALQSEFVIGGYADVVLALLSSASPAAAARHVDLLSVAVELLALANDASLVTVLCECLKLARASLGAHATLGPRLLALATAQPDNATLVRDLRDVVRTSDAWSRCVGAQLPEWLASANSARGSETWLWWSLVFYSLQRLAALADAPARVAVPTQACADAAFDAAPRHAGKLVQAFGELGELAHLTQCGAARQRLRTLSRASVQQPSRRAAGTGPAGRRVARLWRAGAARHAGRALAAV